MSTNEMRFKCMSTGKMFCLYKLLHFHLYLLFGDFNIRNLAFECVSNVCEEC